MRTRAIYKGKYIDPYRYVQVGWLGYFIYLTIYPYTWMRHFRCGRVRVVMHTGHRSNRAYRIGTQHYHLSVPKRRSGIMWSLQIRRWVLFWGIR